MSSISSVLLPCLKKISLTVAMGLPLLVSCPIMASVLLSDSPDANYRYDRMPTYERVSHALYQTQVAIEKINNILTRPIYRSELPSTDVLPGSYLSENDRLAKRALLRMSEKLQRTANVISTSLGFVGTSEFYSYQNDICLQTDGLVMLTRGGRMAANLPFRGEITGYDFDDIETDLHLIRIDIDC
ncbi:MAG: hypothetical protein HQK53_19400 [Oligoflexia bacterium]|nr:hypothetical protein [Oligoflexia bacterium]